MHCSLARSSHRWLSTFTCGGVRAAIYAGITDLVTCLQMHRPFHPERKIPQTSIAWVKGPIEPLLVKSSVVDEIKLYLAAKFRSTSLSTLPSRTADAAIFRDLALLIPHRLSSLLDSWNGRTDGQVRFTDSSCCFAALVFVAILSYMLASLLAGLKFSVGYDSRGPSIVNSRSRPAS